MTEKQILALSKFLNQTLLTNVSKLQVKNFKVKWCDENLIISTIIKSEFDKYLEQPILDVGAGLGDIAYNSFPDKNAVLLDIHKVNLKDFPISKKHQRVTSCFFDYTPKQKFKTLLISHSLQFIDEDIQKLNEKIDELNPEYIILVINKNDGFMGELLSWIKDQNVDINPEEDLSNFPVNYKITREIPFTAILKCPSYQELAKQIAYLVVLDNKAIMPELCKFLKTKLSNPSFKISQSIKVFEQNGK